MEGIGVRLVLLRHVIGEGVTLGRGLEVARLGSEAQRQGEAVDYDAFEVHSQAKVAHQPLKFSVDSPGRSRGIPGPRRPRPAPRGEPINCGLYVTSRHAQVRLAHLVALGEDL